MERDGKVQRIVRDSSFNPLHRSKRTEMQETHKQFLVISGISGSGKTAYGRHLEEEKGFYFFSTDDRWKHFTEEMPFKIEGLVNRWLDRHPLVCLEWGFMPQLIPYVLELKRQGARLIWFFTAVEATARWAYCLKWDGDPFRLELWEDQMERIRNARLPSRDFQLVETFQNGHFRSFPELDREIL